MKSKYKILILLLIVMIAGCTKPTTTVDPKPPQEADKLITYIDNNKVFFRDIKEAESRLILEPKGELSVIIPNPTMKVIAYVEKSQDEKLALKIYDWDNNQHYDVSEISTEMPYISWSSDGCFLMMYEAEIGDWGNALIYDFVAQRVCCELSTIGEPSWNIDSNRIVAHVPQDLKEPIPFGDGHSSSLVIFDVVDGASTTIYEGNNKTMYRSLKWIGDNEIAYRHFDVESGEEQIRSLNLMTSKDIDITDKVNELIFNNEEVPIEFYQYQYYELSQDKKHAILATVKDNTNIIYIYDMESKEIRELTEGYFASWVRWKLD